MSSPHAVPHGAATLAATDPPNALPIVWVQRGFTWFTPYAILNARRFNPRSMLYLISDVRPAGMAGVRHFPLREFWKSAAQFERVYRHFNTSPPEFELFCLQRWLVLNEFLQAMDLTRCFCVDNDVLLYCDVSADAAHFAVSAATYISTLHGASGHAQFGPLNGYINDASCLHRFQEFLLDLYVHHEARLETWFNAYQATPKPGGVTDMLLFHWFAEADAATFDSLCRPFEGRVHDYNIHVADGFEMNGNVKRVFWREGLPWGRLSASGEWLRFNSLHFHGDAKPLMRTHLTIPFWQRGDLLGLWPRYRAQTFGLRLCRALRRRLAR